MSEADTLECFTQVKPIADALFKHPEKMTRESSHNTAVLLNKLLQILEQTQNPEATISKATSHYLVTPLIHVMKSMTMEERYQYEIVIEPWLKIMEFLLSKTLIRISMPKQFTTELVILFTPFIDQARNTKTNEIVSKSEEVKHMAVKCLSAALPAKYKEGRYSSFEQSPYFSLTEEMRKQEFIPIAAQTVVVLLRTIQYEHNIELRLDSIQTLSQLLLDNVYDRETIARFMPGIVSKLSTTLSQKGEKGNHQLTCEALFALEEIIESVMSDDYNATLVNVRTFQDVLNQIKVNNNNSDSEPQAVASQKIMDKEWYATTKEKLFHAMKPVLEIKLYPDWRARLAFVEFAYKLLSKCSRTLDIFIKPLIEIMVLHTDDTYSEVSNACKYRMDILMNSVEFEKTIVPVLRDDLYEWILKFPQYMISRDEQEKINAASLITGLLLLLGNLAENILSIALSRASDGWMSALEIDENSLNVLEEKEGEKFIELKSSTAKSSHIYPKLRLKHVVTDITTAKITRMLNVLGKCCDLQSWIRHFMRYIESNDVSSDPQAAYIVHSLLSGALLPDSIDDKDLQVDDWINHDDFDSSNNVVDNSHLNSITIQLLNDTMEILTNATTNTKPKTLTKASSAFTIDQETNQVLTICLALQNVGLAASILDQETLQDQLITILYPLLAHLGSPNVYIHTYALITLDTIAIACKLKNAQELAIRNIDYIINEISQHISILSSNLRVPLVLKALIHVGGYASIKYLDDSVEEVFEALSRYNLDEPLCAQLCSVLLEIVQTLENHLPAVQESAFQDEREPSSAKSIPEVSNDITEFIKYQQDNQDVLDRGLGSMEEIGKYFLDRQEKGLHDDLTLDQIMEQGNLPIKDDDEQGDSAADIEEKKIPLTHEQEMTKNIMEKSSHFLTASSPQLRSHILVLLGSGVTILSDHPQELNQIIHSLWPSIINRFNDKENFVVFHAASLLEKTVKVSTDFLTSKFTKDLWPRFKTILQRGIHAVTKTNKSVDYSIYSVYHRTQLYLLKTLARVAAHVPLNQHVIKEILEETKYYYNNSLEVHAQLNDACQILFTLLATQQPDTVWLYETACDRKALDEYVHPPSSLLDPISIPEWMKRPSTYTAASATVSALTI